MELLKQNSKLSKSSTDKTIIYNFGIPAIKTCPMAGACKVGCYAKSGTYNFPAVVKAYENRYQVTLLDSFVKAMIDEISDKQTKALKRGKKIMIRIHDSGDFYNRRYLSKWSDIIDCFPEIQFYCYTKRIDLFKAVRMPDNLSVTFSYGGKLDHRIDRTTDRHSVVFENAVALKRAKYANGTDDDKVAAIGKSNKIGLVYHGNKSWENTKWMQ